MLDTHRVFANGPSRTGALSVEAPRRSVKAAGRGDATGHCRKSATSVTMILGSRIARVGGAHVHSIHNLLRRLGLSAERWLHPSAPGFAGTLSGRNRYGFAGAREAQAEPRDQVGREQ